MQNRKHGTSNSQLKNRKDEQPLRDLSVATNDDLTLLFHLTLSHRNRILILVIYLSACLIETFVWKFYFNTVLVRIPFSILVLPFFFIEYWPPFFEKRIAQIWKGLVVVALPFTFSSILLFEIALTPQGLEWNHNALTEYVLAMLIFFQLFSTTKETVTLWFAGTIMSFTLIILSGLLPNIPLRELGTALVPYAITVFVMGTALRTAIQHFYQQRELGAWRSTNAIAHQLRTPLQTINNHICTLEKKFPAHDLNPNSNELSQLSEYVKDEIQYSNKIIDHLVANTRHISQEKIELKRYSVKAIVEHAINSYPYNNPIEAKQIETDLQDYTILGSKYLLTHTIYNLISNAIEHSKNPGCRIQISTRKGELWNLLTVRDDGRGISKRDRRYVFQPFYTTNPQTGTGIGLSFCKEVMRAFGGRIDLTSVVNEFTEFKLSFPKFD